MTDHTAENLESPRETPLTTIEAIAPEMIDALSAHWITTAEGLIAAAATEAGHTGLCRVLSCDSAALDALVDMASQALPPERVAGLRQPVEPHAMGLLLPEAQGPQPTPTTEEGEQQ